MTKQEFLKTLQSSLTGKISDRQVAEHLNYYEEYISSEIRSGKPEAEVMDSLGDPRLIARSILAAGGGEEQTGANAGGRAEGYYSGGANGRYQSGAGGQYGGGTNGYYGGADEPPTGRTFRISAWGWMLIVVLGLMLIFSLVFSVIRILFPILFPIMMVIFFIKLFRDWLN